MVVLTDSNHFPRLGDGATLAGCNNDSQNFIGNILQGPWKRSGYDKGYLLSENLNTADNVREKLAEVVDLAQDGDTLIAPVNSSHGTDFIDYLTGQKMNCTVCYGSTWDQPRSFLSALDYQRAFAKLRPGVRVWCFFDSCESGNIGMNFKMLETFTHRNRWIEPPMDVAADLAKIDRIATAGRALPQQVCTMAGCQHPGTCADIQGPNPHGLFSGTRDPLLLADNTLTWYGLAAKINAQFAAQGDEQRCVPNGPDVSFNLA